MFYQKSGYHDPAKLSHKIHHHWYYGYGSIINYDFNKFSKYLMNIYCVLGTVFIHWNIAVNKPLTLLLKD